jgi:ATP-dependent Lhr-like helicase
VVSGNKELGFISPLALPRQHASKADAKPVLVNGRAWRVERVDWERFEVAVSPVGDKGDVRWHSGAIALSFELMRAQRDVLLGQTPDVPLSQRAVERLDLVRQARAEQVTGEGLVVKQSGNDVHLWSWAGLKAHETLRAGLGGAEGQSYNDVMILRGVGELSRLATLSFDEVIPHVPAEMAESLKFSAALPEAAAIQTLAERFADRPGAQCVAREVRVTAAVDPLES